MTGPEPAALADAQRALLIGDADEALVAADRAASDLRLFEGWVRCVRGLALARLGRAGEAETALRDAQATVAEPGTTGDPSASLVQALADTHFGGGSAASLGDLVGELLADGAVIEALLAVSAAAAAFPEDAQAALMHGQARLAVNDRVTARAELERAIGLGAVDPAARLGLFDLDAAEGQEDAAAGHLERLEPWDELDGTTRVEVARRLLVLGRVDDAARLVADVDVATASSRARMVVGTIHAWRQSNDEAISTLELELTTDPPSAEPDIYLLLSRLVRDRDGPEAALVVTDKGLRFADFDGRLVHQRAQHLLELNRLEEAETWVDWGVALRPDDEELHVTRANVLGTSGRVDEARAAADRALELQPDYLPAYQAKAEAMRVAGDFDGALAVIRVAHALDPEDPWTARQLTLALWRSAEARGWPADVLQQVADAAQAWEASAPHEALAFVFEARALDRLDRDEVAVAAYQHALELEPLLIDARIELAQLFGRTDRAELAAEHFDRLVADHPGHPAVRIGRAAFRRGRGDYEGAAADLTALIDADPSNGDAWSQRAETWRQAEQFDRALEDIDQALRLKVDDGWTLGTKGQILRALGRDQEALEVLNRAAALAEPGDLIWIDLERLQLNRRLGNLTVALGLATELLERSPANVVALGELGEVHRLEGRLDDAKAALEAALEQDPDEPFALGTLGQVLTELRQYDTAAERLSRAAELDPTSGWIQSSLADVHRVLGNYQESLEHVDSAIALEPDNDRYRSTRAETLRALGQPAEALAEAQNVLERNPEDWFTLGTAAQAELDLGRPAEALTLAERAVAARQDYGFGWAAHTSALVELDRYPEALVSAGRYREAELDAPDSLGMYAAVLLGLGGVEESRDLLVGTDEEPTAFLRFMRGVAHMLAGDAAAAVPELTEAVRLDEDDAWNHSWLADALAATGEQEEAEVHWKRGIEVTADVSAPAAAVLGISGWCKLCLGQHEAAARRYLRAIGLGNASMSIRFEAVLVLLASGQDEHGRRQLEEWFADLATRPVERQRGLLREARHTSSLVDRFGLVDTRGRPAYDALTARVQQSLEGLPAGAPRATTMEEPA